LILILILIFNKKILLIYLFIELLSFFSFSFFSFPFFFSFPLFIYFSSSLCGLGWAVPVCENLDTWKVGGRENEVVSKG